MITQDSLEKYKVHIQRIIYTLGVFKKKVKTPIEKYKNYIKLCVVKIETTLSCIEKK